MIVPAIPDSGRNPSLICIVSGVTRKIGVALFGGLPHRLDQFSNSSQERKSTFLVIRVKDRTEQKRRPFPIVPICRPASVLRFWNAFGLQFIELDKNPPQMARLCA